MCDGQDQTLKASSRKSTTSSPFPISHPVAALTDGVRTSHGSILRLSSRCDCDERDAYVDGTRRARSLTSPGAEPRSRILSEQPNLLDVERVFDFAWTSRRRLGLITKTTGPQIHRIASQQTGRRTDYGGSGLCNPLFFAEPHGWLSAGSTSCLDCSRASYICDLPWC